MKAFCIRAHGDEQQLEWQESYPDPKVGPDDVLVGVRACAVNHLDLWVRRGVPGHRFPLPLVPGSDVSGTVLEVGERVTAIAVGDAVVVAPGVSCGVCVACLGGCDHECSRYGVLGEHRDGGYAERLLVPAINVVRKPEAMPFETAAAIGVPFLTAWHMLVRRAQLTLGETVLVHAAGSSVGQAAWQIAQLLHCQVIVTCGGAWKARKAQDLGLTTIDYATENVSLRVKELTNGKGADVVVEHVGAATWEQSLKALAWRGRLVTCGATTGHDVRVNLRHLFFKAQSLLGSTMGSKADFHRVVGLVAQGKLRPVIDSVIPLSQAQDAHRRLGERSVFGRIVLTP